MSRFSTIDGQHSALRDLERQRLEKLMGQLRREARILQLQSVLNPWFLKIQNEKLVNLPTLLNIKHQESSHLFSPGGADSKSSPLPAPTAKGACLQGSQRTRGAPERCTVHCERAQLCADATAATANDNPSGNNERSERIKCTHRAKCRDGMAAACQREI